MDLIDVVELSKKLCKYPLEAKLVYTTAENFVGRPLKGYHQDVIDICLLTPKAAEALCHVQTEITSQHPLGLLVYDTYRPKRAVLDMAEWAKSPAANEHELKRKALHYPNIEKAELFPLGYIAEDSNHCYGNTVDLVLIDLETKQLVDMGAIFDYMDELSHLTVTEKEIGKQAFQYREILRNAMEKFGFEPYEKEYWHYCHGGPSGREIKQAMDFEITANLKGLGVDAFLEKTACSLDK